MLRRARTNPEVKMDRLLGLLAHCVRNVETASESRQGCDRAAKMLMSHSPDEVVQALAAGWRANGSFPGALEKFRSIWREVSGSRPEFAGRSLDDVIAMGSEQDTEEVFKLRRRGESPVAMSPQAARWRQHKEAREKEPLPPWQTDQRSSHNKVNEAAGFADKNYCLREIYRRSINAGGMLLRVTFWTFDGTFQRGFFTAFCSESELGYGGMAADAWVGSGENPYRVKAVFATVAGVPGKALLVRLIGADVADVSDGLWIEFLDQNENPLNDPAFMRSATTLVALAEERLGASPGRPRRVSGSFHCGECQRRIQLEGGAMPAACQFCDADLRQFKDWPLEFERSEVSFEKAWQRRRNRTR